MNSKLLGKSRHGGLIVWILLMLPVLYVLSIGPAAWWVNRSPRSYGVSLAVEWFYAPLSWLITERTPLMKPLQMYIDLWSPPDISGSGCS
jgi:hypothetical protein